MNEPLHVMQLMPMAEHEKVMVWTSTIFNPSLGAEVIGQGTHEWYLNPKTARLVETPMGLFVVNGVNENVEDNV